MKRRSRSGLVVVCVSSAVLLLASCTSGSGDPSEITTSLTGGRETTPSSAASDSHPAEPDNDPSRIEPITGYGDFSAVEYWEVDWFEMTELVVRCANENGVPLKVLPPGDGWSLEDVGIDQQMSAEATIDACVAGLKLPTEEPPTEEQIRRQYDSLIDVKRCLEREGYAIIEPPSFETFLEDWAVGPWHPYLSLPQLAADERHRLNELCPQP